MGQVLYLDISCVCVEGLFWSPLQFPRPKRELLCADWLSSRDPGYCLQPTCKMTSLSKLIMDCLGHQTQFTKSIKWELYFISNSRAKDSVTMQHSKTCFKPSLFYKLLQVMMIPKLPGKTVLGSIL